MNCSTPRCLQAILFVLALALVSPTARAANPAIVDPLTADPAALVHKGTVYLYTGHDEADEKHHGYVMNKWLCFSSTDMVNWKQHPSPLAFSDFTWALKNAWAGQVIERDGKFFWYVPMEHKTIHGFAIGVAVSDSPTGPFKDAKGSALITNDMTTDVKISWDDIDPSVFIDDDGQAYLFWGNQRCRYIKLKKNMIETEGPIVTVDLPKFTEAPWVHKRGNLYYLSYAYDWPEKTAYATAEKITGPWIFRGVIQELAGNCNTNHQSIIEYKGRSYFIYHNGGTPQGGSFRRSVCIDYLNYNPDGTIQHIIPTSEGVAPAKD
ncbi:MAG: glycoside hydrolase family 43 protein [Nibricoccus sp.]